MENEEECRHMINGAENMGKYVFSIFTKPWKTMSVPELGQFVSGLGFDGIEFPLRPGYQLEPENAEKGLPELAKQLGGYGVRITSVASELSESVFAGCAGAGVPIIRIMIPIGEGGYLETERRTIKELENALPLCERYGVKIGIQPHYGEFVSNSMETLHIVENFDPKYIGAIWDAAHSGLAGEEPEQGLDIVWEHLCMVNFKTAFYRRANGPESDCAVWERHFTTGAHGMTSWPRAVKYLINRNYSGIICLPAEYTDEALSAKYIAQDMGYIKSLFQSGASDV